MKSTHINASVKSVFAASFRYEGEIQMVLKMLRHCPGWCGSVDPALACEPRGCWFDSQ